MFFASSLVEQNYGAREAGHLEARNNVGTIHMNTMTFTGYLHENALYPQRTSLHACMH